MKLRGWLYFIAKLLGDVNSVKKNKVGKRIGRRIVGKIVSRNLWR